MKKYLPVLLFLTACQSSGGGNNPPLPQAQGWTATYSIGISACDDFNFGELHYCIKQQQAQIGQTIRMAFTISGSGTLYPVERADAPPATLRLFIASDPSGTSMTRWWCPTSRTDLSNGSFSVSCTITSEWGGVYGQANVPPIGGINYVGFTMGGQSFAGHGVAATNGPVHFHLDSYTVGANQLKRKR